MHIYESYGLTYFPEKRSFLPKFNFFLKGPFLWILTPWDRGPYGLVPRFPAWSFHALNAILDQKVDKIGSI